MLSPDGRHVAVSSHDRIIRLYDLATREQVGQLAALKRPATSLCFLADGGFLASVCQDNSVQLWDLESRSLAATLWGPADESFVSLALFGESNHLAVAARRRPHPRLGPKLIRGSAHTPAPLRARGVNPASLATRSCLP